MRVGELINELQRFSEDEEIYIGEYQTFGNDFVYTMDEVQTNGISKYYGNDKDSAPMLILGRQIGVIK